MAACGRLGDPEVYPRPDGTVYVTGYPDAPAVVDERPGEVEVRADVAAKLEAAMREASCCVGNQRPSVLDTATQPAPSHM